LEAGGFPLFPLSLVHCQVGVLFWEPNSDGEAEC